MGPVARAEDWSVEDRESGTVCGRASGDVGFDISQSSRSSLLAMVGPVEDLVLRGAVGEVERIVAGARGFLGRLAPTRIGAPHEMSTVERIFRVELVTGLEGRIDSRIAVPSIAAVTWVAEPGGSIVVHRCKVGQAGFTVHHDTEMVVLQFAGLLAAHASQPRGAGFYRAGQFRKRHIDSEE